MANPDVPEDLSPFYNSEGNWYDEMYDSNDPVAIDLNERTIAVNSYNDAVDEDLQYVNGWLVRR